MPLKTQNSVTRRITDSPLNATTFVASLFRLTASALSSDMPTNNGGWKGILLPLNRNRKTKGADGGRSKMISVQDVQERKAGRLFLGAIALPARARAHEARYAAPEAVRMRG